MNFMKVSVLRISLPFKFLQGFRNISFSIPLLENESESEPVEAKLTNKYADEKTRILYSGMPYEPVDIATSIDYLKSKEYREVYLDKPVWFYYRRNFGGHFPPRNTRENCVFAGKVATKNACPICRDNHLIFSYKHLELLKQFVDPVSGEALETDVNHLCQKQHSNLLFNLEMAYQLGLLEKAIPIRLYDYNEYYSHLPPDLNLLSVPISSTMEMLPNAARIYTISEENVEIVRPSVPTRYSLEHKDYLEKRARKLAELKSAKLKMK